MWVDWWGVESPSPVSRAETGGSHYTQVTAVVLRDISTGGGGVQVFSF